MNRIQRERQTVLLLRRNDEKKFRGHVKLKVVLNRLRQDALDIAKSVTIISCSISLLIGRDWIERNVGGSHRLPMDAKLTTTSTRDVQRRTRAGPPHWRSTTLRGGSDQLERGGSICPEAI